ncbi:MAG: hypothetical protein AB1483_07785 [Candidatus Zixiibacteriota bacterium]
MRGLTRSCISEMVDRKIFWVFIVVTMIAIAVILVSGQAQFGGGRGDSMEMNLGEVNEALGNPVTRGFAIFIDILVVLAVLATAGLIPSMLIRGRADFYLSKPISRTSLLVNKFFGILVAYSVVVVVCGLAGNLVMYLVHGIYSDNIIYVYLLNLVSLFIWLSITTFAGILFGSGSMAVMTAVLVWFLQYLLQYRDFVNQFVESRFVIRLMDIFYYILPKTSELSDLTIDVAVGSRVASWLPLYTSLAFGAAALIAAIFVFNRRDY